MIRVASSIISMPPSPAAVSVWVSLICSVLALGRCSLRRARPPSEASWASSGTPARSPGAWGFGLKRRRLVPRALARSKPGAGRPRERCHGRRKLRRRRLFIVRRTAATVSPSLTVVSGIGGARGLPGRPLAAAVTAAALLVSGCAGIATPGMMNHVGLDRPEMRQFAVATRTDMERDVRLETGSRKSETLTPTLFWSGIAVGTIGAVGGISFGVLGFVTKNELNDAYTQGSGLT